MLDTAAARGLRQTLSRRNKAGRFCWNIVSSLLYRPSPAPFHGWRRLLLRCFGASIARGVLIYPKARVWAPWNLRMEEGSCMGNDVDCYCVAPVVFERQAIVSQYSYLCTASHDYEDEEMPLIAAPISIGAGAWVAAAAYVGPGVRVGEGAVVAARAVVVRDVEPWTVSGGNPAKLIRHRRMSNAAGAE